MQNELIQQQYFVQPGYICLPHKETLLYSVAGSGIVVTLYDRVKKHGGMSHFIKPKRIHRSITTPVYAYPSVAGLLKMMMENGSELVDLEAQVFGGATNREVAGYISGLAEENINVAFKILKHKKIAIAGIDIGCHRGRKVMFNTFSGETIVSKVNKIREEDWYPVVSHG